MVLRPAAAISTLAILLSGCGDSLKSKEKVQAAIVERLQERSGLDLKTLDVTTTSLSFDKNMAYATVAFHPKGDTSIHSGMEMRYMLEERDGKWVVVKVASPNGKTVGSEPSNSTPLPAGHPPVNGGASPGGSPNGTQMPPENPHGTVPHRQGADGPNR